MIYSHHSFGTTNVRRGQRIKINLVQLLSVIEQEIVQVTPNSRRRRECRNRKIEFTICSQNLDKESRWRISVWIPIELITVARAHNSAGSNWQWIMKRESWNGSEDFHVDVASLKVKNNILLFWSRTAELKQMVERELWRDIALIGRILRYLNFWICRCESVRVREEERRSYYIAVQSTSNAW